MTAKPTKPVKRTKHRRKRAATLPAIKPREEHYFCKDIRQMFLPLWQVGLQHRKAALPREQWSCIAGEDGERVLIDRPLRVGDVVKVCLPIDPKRHPGEECCQAEWPWAIVVELIPNNRWRGEISNNLLYDHGFDAGSVITFKRCSDDSGREWSWEPESPH